MSADFILTAQHSLQLQIHDAGRYLAKR